MEPSTYVFEMITFLTAYVDSVLIGLNEDIKTRAYASALNRIRQWMMVSSKKKLPYQEGIRSPEADVIGNAMRQRGIKG